MKKEYIAPEMEIIEVNTEAHLLSVSELPVSEGEIDSDEGVGAKNHSFDAWGFED